MFNDNSIACAWDGLCSLPRVPLLFLWLCVGVSGLSQWSTCALDDADSVSYHADHGSPDADAAGASSGDWFTYNGKTLGDHKTSSPAHRQRCSSHVAYELQSWQCWGLPGAGLWILQLSSQLASAVVTLLGTARACVSSILYGLLIFWHCWWLPGLLFSSQWAYDIFTLLGACQELGFELFYVQINGLLIKQWVFAVATWKHSCFRNVTCAWYHCIIQDQSVLYLCVIGSIPAWVKWVPLLLTWSVINLEVFGLLKCCMSTWHSFRRSLELQTEASENIFFSFLFSFLFSLLFSFFFIFFHLHFFFSFFSFFFNFFLI